MKTYEPTTSFITLMILVFLGVISALFTINKLEKENKQLETAYEETISERDTVYLQYLQAKKDLNSLYLFKYTVKINCGHCRNMSTLDVFSFVTNDEEKDLLWSCMTCKGYNKLSKRFINQAIVLRK